MLGLLLLAYLAYRRAMRVLTCLLVSCYRLHNLCRPFIEIFLIASPISTHSPSAVRHTKINCFGFRFPLELCSTFASLT
uniref:Putative secreted protein n=1 Tax=Anopheles darlingi TaxID=43151 RepID=A0A2M4DSB0_ANODA